MFNKYKNINGDSNVDSYEIGLDYIAITFIGSSVVYYYTYHSCGGKNVEQMKLLAKQGNGLNGFINKYCRFKYDKKVKY